MSETIYVDTSVTQSGSGSSAEDPVSSLAEATSMAGDGDLILLRAGTRVPLEATVPLSGLRIDSYGHGEPPLIDLRQNISSLTWSEINPGVWTTNVTFRDAPVINAGANEANTSHHQVWLGEQSLNWYFDEGSINENVAALTADNASFTIHNLGSDVADPRFDTPGEDNFAVYVGLPDGVSPQDVDLYISDQQTLSIEGVLSISNVSFIGSYGKDTLGTQQTFGNLDDYPVLHNVEILYAPAHAIVGPFLSSGLLTVTGRGDAGHEYHEYGFNSEGGLINIYTSNRYEAEISFDEIVAENGYKAVYGHGSTPGESYGYSLLSIGSLQAASVDVAIDMTGVFEGVPFVEEIVVGNIVATGISRAVMTSGNAKISSAELTFASSGGLRANHAVFEAYGDNQVFSLSNADLTFNRALDAISMQHAWVGGDKDSVASATLILDGVTDNSGAENSAYIPRLYEYGPSLVITGDSKVGNLQALSGLDDKALPSALVVTAGSTFGLGDRTGAEIEAFLDGLGISFWISSDTTIIARDGTVLSEPGWEHSEFAMDRQNDFGTDENDVLGGSVLQDFLGGNDGDDVLAGGDSMDFLFGGAGNDTILGGEGNDFVQAGDGDDLVRGGIGADIIYGGDGEDTADYSNSDEAFYYNAQSGQVFGAAVGERWNSVERFILTDFDDSLLLEHDMTGAYGGAGDDRFWGGGGQDLFGDSGNDELISLGRVGALLMEGGDGDDIYRLGKTDDRIVITRDSGNDTVFGFRLDGGSDRIDLTAFATDFENLRGAGQQTDEGVLFTLDAGTTLLMNGIDLSEVSAENFIFVNRSATSEPGLAVSGQSAPTVTGTDSDDPLPGSGQGDVIYGGAGDDVIEGFDGDDTLIGGRGADKLDGGAGIDSVSYATEEKYFYYDALSGMALGSAAGDAWISIERFVLTDFADTFVAAGEDSHIAAGAGNDRIWGGGGSDVLDGGAGDDLLNSRGDGGHVLFIGGTGNDIINAGNSTDRVLFRPGDGHDTIHQFRPGSDDDVLDFSEFGETLTGFADVLPMIRADGFDLRIELSADDSILLTNTGIADVSDDWFVF